MPRLDLAESTGAIWIPATHERDGPNIHPVSRWWRKAGLLAANGLKTRWVTHPEKVAVSERLIPIVEISNPPHIAITLLHLPSPILSQAML